MRQLRKKEIKQVFKEFKRDKEIFVILENIQYATNVAAIFRTLDAAGVRRVYLTGITKTPPFGKDLSKTSRQKEKSVEWVYEKDSGKIIQTLKKLNFKIVGVEITDNAISSYKLEEALKNDEKVCLVVGSEVYGVKKETLERCDLVTFIPMFGNGASLNVSASLAIALYSF